MAIQERVKAFIVGELTWDGDASQLTEDFPLIEKRVLDSLGIFQLVTFLEAEYGIAVDDDELVPENFGSLAAIERFVNEKKG
jgi:acyl carrier protein